jgi:spoIIIJ-associated protein
MPENEMEFKSRGANVEAAIESGLSHLGVPREDVEIDILDEGSRGILGIGSRDAVVLLRVRRREVDADIPASIVEEPPVPVEPMTEYPLPPSPIGATEEPPAHLAEAEVVAPAPEDEDWETEAQVAVEVIGDLLGKMGIGRQSVTWRLSSEDDLSGQRVIIVDVASGDDLGLLIGSRGETLDALQYLARLIVGNRLQKRASFQIDVDGYRDRRAAALARLAERMAGKAIKSARPVTLEPMPASERRVIHMALRESAHVYTESTGTGDQRRVRIYPK